MEELNIEEEENKRIKEIEVRRAERQKVAEKKEKYKERIQELADRKKRYMKYLANWRREHRGESKESALYKSEEIMQTKKELDDAIGMSVEKGVVNGKTNSIDWKNRPLNWKKWLREEWDGYKHGGINTPEEFAEHVLRSRNSERIVRMTMSNIVVEYDKWSNEVTLATIKRPE